MIRILIVGAGNLLLSDEGFGVHFVRYLARCYQLSPAIELLDAGTLGLMITHQIEDADRVYLIDALDSTDQPGSIRRYEKEQLLDSTFQLKLSPHQVGLREMLLITELRGRCPAEIILLGVVPESLAPGTRLSPRLESCLAQLAEELMAELRPLGLRINSLTAQSSSWNGALLAPGEGMVAGALE